VARDPRRTFVCGDRPDLIGGPLATAFDVTEELSTVWRSGFWYRC